MSVVDAARTLSPIAATNHWIGKLRNSLLVGRRLVTAQARFRDHNEVSFTGELTGEFAGAIMHDVRGFLEATSHRAREPDIRPEPWPWWTFQQHAPGIWHLFTSPDWLEVIHRITNLDVQPVIDHEELVLKNAIGADRGVTLLWDIPRECFARNSHRGIELRLMFGVVASRDAIGISADGTALVLQWRL